MDPYPQDPQIISHRSPPGNCQPDRALEQLVEVTAEHRFKGKPLQGWGAVFRDVLFALDQRPLYGTVPQSKNIDLGTKDWKQKCPLSLLSLLMTLKVLCSSYLHNSEFCILRGLDP